MNYIIHTPSAVRLKKEIINSVDAKVDANGKGIALWQCTKTDAGERVLVHTLDQWTEKCCLVLSHNKSHGELQVRFHYWNSCEEKTSDDEKILFGRFTEFLLVHFSYYIDKISIA